MKYPCGMCGRAVKWSQQAIECENCSTWFQKQCLQMSDKVFEVLQNHPSYTWVCCSCGLPNFSTFVDSSLALNLSDSFKDGDQGDTILPPPPHPGVIH